MKRLLILFLAALVSCGKRGDPRPPVPVIPKATSDLVVTQRAGKLLLSWSYPSLTTAGKTLTSIRRVALLRYSEELPAVPAVTAPPEPAAALTQFSKVPQLTAVQFGKLSHRIDSIESANLSGSSVGAKLVYEDTPPLRGPSGRPVRLSYAVVTEGAGARSDLSNIVTIVPLPVSVPPSNVTGEAKVDGVALAWSAPAKSATGEGAPMIAGYYVYRLTAGEVVDQFAVPVNPTPVKEVQYKDVPPYGTFEYRVTAVASAGPPRIESEPSPAVPVTFKDLVAPPPPPSVTALVETRVVRLVWDAVSAPDLAGYNVYRTEKAGRVKFTYGLPIPQTHFGDESLLPGIEYYYSVTSVDKNGNESAETKSQTVMVPKSP